MNAEARRTTLSRIVLGYEPEDRRVTAAAAGGVGLALAIALLSHDAARSVAGFGSVIASAGLFAARPRRSLAFSVSAIVVSLLITII